jgi:tetratricopeptide (TPR) repeat protein
MFFKKKDKGEAPKANGKAPEPPREERRPEPPRAAAPPPPAAPPPQAARPAPQPPPQAPSSGSRGPGAAIDAALNAARGPAGAPPSAPSVLAQARAADLLAQSSDSTDKAAAQNLAAGRIDQAFDALQAAAQKINDEGRDKIGAANRWRTLGALAFNVQAGRSKWAYEHLFNFEPRQFWDCIFLARLRGLGQQLEQAKEAATTALSVAANDAEKGAARAELGLIALATKDGAQAIQHAEESIAIARRVGAGPGGPRDFLARLVLLGDAALAVGEGARARAAFTEALDLVKRDAQANPSDSTIARAMCEVLEKCAASAAHGKDHAAAKAQIEEALGIRRRVQSALTPVEGKRGVSQTLVLKAELMRAAGDGAAAKAAYEESLGLLRQVAEAEPRNGMAQRDVWVAMWRMAVANIGMDWRQVVGAMERMDSAGALDEDGKRFLGEAKRRAAA